MPIDTRLSDLAKEIEYLKNKHQEIELMTIADCKSIVTIGQVPENIVDLHLALDSHEAKELKEYLLTIIDHGILRLQRDLRTEL